MSKLVKIEEGHNFTINNNEKQFSFLQYCSRCNIETLCVNDVITSIKKFYYIIEQISCNEIIIKNIIE